MRRARGIFAALGAWLAIAPGLPAAPPAPTVEEIIARHVDARGGLGALKSIGTLREKGLLIAGPARKALVTRQIKRPHRARLEFTVQGITSVYVSDGERGWKMSPSDGDTEPKPLPDQAVLEAAEHVDLEGPLVDWKAKGHAVELVGREKVGSLEAWKIRITLKSGAIRHEYLDVASHHRIRTDSTRLLRGRNVKLQTTFSDFRKTGGVVFPHHVDVEAVGRPQRVSLEVLSVEINPALSDDLFTMPHVRPSSP